MRGGEREREGQADRQTDRQIDRQTETARQRQKQRNKQRERERERANTVYKRLARPLVTATYRLIFRTHSRHKRKTSVHGSDARRSRNEVSLPGIND